MKALVMIAHGSRREEANREFALTVQKVRAVQPYKYDVVEYCFLEMATPSLPDTIKKIIDDGITDISILPYFLNSGNHVLIDIPAMVKQLFRDYPTCNIEILPYFGAFEKIEEFISKHLQANT